MRRLTAAAGLLLAALSLIIVTASVAPPAAAGGRPLRYLAGPAGTLDPAREQAWFIAWSPANRAAFGYVWRRADFPWLGVWDENHSHEQPPWNGRTLTRGMEFGASPFPETRREMIQRGSLFGEPAYRWIPARGRLSAEYCAFLIEADRIPEDIVPATDPAQPTA